MSVQVRLLGTANSGRCMLTSALIQAFEQNRHQPVEKAAVPRAVATDGEPAKGSEAEEKRGFRVELGGEEIQFSTVPEASLENRTWRPGTGDIVVAVVSPLRASMTLARDGMLEYVEQIQGRGDLTFAQAVKAGLHTLFRLDDEGIKAIPLEGLQEILDGKVGSGGRLAHHPGLPSPYIVEGVHLEASERILQVFHDVASSVVRREWAQGLGRLSSILHNHRRSILVLTHDDLFNFLTRTGSDARAFDELRNQLLGPAARFGQFLRVKTCSVRLCRSGCMDYVEEVLLEDAGRLVQSLEAELGLPGSAAARRRAARRARWVSIAAHIGLLAIPVLALAVVAQFLGPRAFVPVLLAAALATLLIWLATAVFLRQKRAGGTVPKLSLSNSGRGWPRLSALSKYFS